MIWGGRPTGLKITPCPSPPPPSPRSETPSDASTGHPPLAVFGARQTGRGCFPRTARPARSKAGRRPNQHGNPNYSKVDHDGVLGGGVEGRRAANRQLIWRGRSGGGHRGPPGRGGSSLVPPWGLDHRKRCAPSTPPAPRTSSSSAGSATLRKGGQTRPARGHSAYLFCITRRANGGLANGMPSRSIPTCPVHRPARHRAPPPLPPPQIGAIGLVGRGEAAARSHARYRR